MDRYPGLSPSERVGNRLRAGMFALVKPTGSRPVRVPLSLLAALLCLALMVLAGCGSSDNGVASKSGKEILAASNEAAAGASSVHVVGKNSQGQASLSVNLHLASNGGRGQVSFLGLNYEVVRTGHTAYVKGSPAFYERLSMVLGHPLHVPAGAWLKTSAQDGPVAQLVALADLRGEVNRLLSTPGSVTKGASTTVNGQKAIELKETTKVYKGVLYVATTGKPYPVALVKSGGKAKNEREKGRIVFSEWDEDVSLNAPSPSVDISTLAGSTVEPK